MSAFEVLFSLFGLLLGFSLVEVLGGLARTVEAQLRPPAPGVPPIRYGWLTPLLGFFVLLDATSFWGAAWMLRDELRMTYPLLMGALFFTATYYLAAHLVFPTDPRPGEDLDEHFYRVRRYVFGALLLLSLVQIVGYMSVPKIAARASGDLVTWVETGVFNSLLAAAMFVRPKRASLAVLCALIALHVYPIFGEISGG